MFNDFISTIPSPRLGTCLIVCYDSDLDDLRRTLHAIPRPKGEPPAMKEEAEQEERDVKITFGLSIEESRAEDHRESIGEALGCAIRNGVFKFSRSTPTLEVLACGQTTCSDVHFSR